MQEPEANGNLGGGVSSLRLDIEATTWADRILALMATLLPIAVTNLVFAPFWTVRMAFVLAVLPVGLSLLIAHALDRDRVSLAALAFMATTAFSTIIAPVPSWNLRGGFGRESSLLFVAGFFAVWSAARRVSRPGRRLVAAGSLIGLGLSGAVGVWQFFAQPANGLLATIGSRPSGLLGNPVYFGACLAGGSALVAHAVGRRLMPIGVGCASLALFAGLVNLSGSRAALLGAIVPVGVAVRRSPHPRSTLIAGSAIGGVLATALLTYAVDGRGTIDRAFEGGSTGTGDGRLGMWTFAWAAFRERPVFGHGFGQFRPAIQAHFDAEYVSRHLTDPIEAVWPDAHNIFIQYSVVGGLAALVPIVLVVFWSARVARGPCAWAVIPVFAVWLTQPVSVATAPLAAVWLGISMPLAPRHPHVQSTPRALRLLTVMGGLLAFALLGLGAQLRRASNQGDVDQFVTWARIAPADPVVAATASSMLSQAGARAESAAWAARAARLEPLDAVTASRYAVRQYDAGNATGALETIRVALDFDRYNTLALTTAGLLAEAEGDDALADLVRQRQSELRREAAIPLERSASDD